MTTMTEAAAGLLEAAASPGESRWASGGGAEISPLPYLPVPELRSVGLARGTRSRLAASRAARVSANQTIWALNNLSGVNPSQSVFPSSARRLVVERILSACRRDVPPENVESPQAALSTLLGSKASPYKGEDPSVSVAFDESLVSLPERGAVCRLSSVLSGRDLLDLEGFRSRLFLSEGELSARRAREGKAKAYWDPTLE